MTAHVGGLLGLILWRHFYDGSYLRHAGDLTQLDYAQHRSGVRTQVSRPEIIVIGASAGGVEALRTLVNCFPHDLPASVLVVVHTSPENGHLAKVLGRNGVLTAVTATHGMPLSPSRIYVAPPNHHLTIYDRHLLLSIGPKVNRHRPAVDPLFESAAETYGKRVIGVVLTGYLDDGTAGLVAIKRLGGIAIVQDPNDAVAPDMPRNALKHAKIDYCLPITEIGPLLVQLVKGIKTKK